MTHKSAHDVMVPELYHVESNVADASDIFTITMTPKEKGKRIGFLPGQFNMVYHFGYGEIPLSVSGDPAHQDVLVHTVRAVGPVSQSLQHVKPGDELGVRGPLGTGWPLVKKDCDVLVVAGGLGLPPLRPALLELIAHKNQYRDITLLYGTKRPDEMIYPNDLESWRKQGMKIEMTVDKPDEAWKGHVGVITPLVKPAIKDPKNTLVLMCGPEIMFKFVAKELLDAEVDADNIFLSLERNMQCGVGFCGRCQLGPYFVCKDGPVFSYAQVKKWLMIKEL